MNARRRTVSAALAAIGLVFSGRGFAQLPRIARIGYLRPSRSPQAKIRLDAFRLGLRELGYAEGKTVLIEERSADGNYDRLPALAAELVRLKVDVILADGGTPSIMAAKNATQSIPIVFPTVYDPVALGLAKSLSRPGGNLTGLSLQAPDASGKQMELLKLILPEAKRIAFLTNPTNASSPPHIQEVRSAAQKIGIEIQVVEARSASELDQAFGLIERGRVSALMLQSDQLLNDSASRIAVLAVKARLPSVGTNREVAEHGGLASYGPDRADMLRRAAGYVDRILKGAKPGDLPIEQPVKFELVINQGTAKALGLNLPQAVLLRADRVIE